VRRGKRGVSKEKEEKETKSMSGESDPFCPRTGEKTGKHAFMSLHKGAT